MKKIFLSLGALATLLLPVAAKEYKLPKESPLFSISFPEKWEVTYEDESVDGVSADGAIELYAQTDDAETIEESVKESIEYLAGEDVEIKADTEKKHEGEIGGMKVTGIDWDGTDKDGPCRISLSFIDIGAEQVITLLYWGSEAAEKKHAKELETILSSMKQLKKGKKEKAKGKGTGKAKEEDADKEESKEEDEEKEEK